MDNVTEKILNYQNQLEESKKEQNREEGKLSTLKTRLKNEFKCNTEEEAKEKIIKKDNEIIEKEKELEDIINKIEKDYDWE